MSNLISRIFADSKKEIEEAWARYAALLRADSSEAKDIKEMRALMEKLGRTPEDLQADLADIGRALSLQKTIADGNGLDQQRRAVGEELSKANEEKAALLARCQARIGKAVVEQQRLDGLHSNGEQSRHALRELKAKRAELLSCIEAPAAE